MKDFITVLALLTAALAARSGTARAEDRVVLHIDAAENLEVYDRTSNVAMVPVSAGRYGSSLERTYVFAPLCDSTPCDPELRPGHHVLALSKPGGKLIEADDSLDLEGPTSVTASYSDRSAVRIAGILTMLGGSAVGLGLMLDGAHRGCAEGTCNELEFGLGIGALAVSFFGGLAMMLTTDGATFTISPLAVAPLPGRREAAGELPAGLAVGLRF